MIGIKKRKDIARAFVTNEYGWCPDLYRGYKAIDEKQQPKSWTPCFSLQFSFVGVAETLKEAKEIAKLESRSYADYKKYKYTDGKVYYIVID